MLDKLKNELLNLGLKFITIDEKLVRLFLETTPSNINEIVILPAVEIVMKKIVNRLENKIIHGKVYNGVLNGVKVSVIRSMVGCPNIAIIVECLKRCKTRIIIRADFCGGIENLNNNIHIGDVIIPKIAYCGDGTSPQYIMKYTELPSQLESITNPISKTQTLITGHQTIFISEPNEKLKELMINEAISLLPAQVKEVDLWTTDALFCETYDFINALRSINIEVIDMESSILFLLGKLYNLKTLSLLSVSDLPGNVKYDLLTSNEIHPDMEKGIDNAIKLLINTLPKIKSLLT